MQKQNICVLIRVYNRVDDLKYCIDIIMDSWIKNEYFIIVVFNGGVEGYEIDNTTLSKIDLLVEVESNIGHFSGNSQLLLAGLPNIPDNCNYTILLEADTWLFGDELICKYVEKLESNASVWASAQFFRYVRNLATDFAIVKTNFVKAHSEIFKFEKTPEYFVANYLYKYKYPYTYITELMPINLPRYIRKFPFAPTGRFFMFIDGKMVTHHIESLANGMDEKKFYFNVVANEKYFDVPELGSVMRTKWLLKLAVFLTVFIPYKSWLFKSKNQF